MATLRVGLVKTAILALFAWSLFLNRDLIVREVGGPGRTFDPETSSGPVSVPGRTLAWAAPPVPDPVLEALRSVPARCRVKLLPPSAPEAEELGRQVSRLRRLGYQNDALIQVLARGALRKPLKKIWRDYTRLADSGGWAEAETLLDGALGECGPDDLLTRKAVLELLVQVLRQAGDHERARARAAEAGRIVERLSALWLDELKRHPDRVAYLKSKGRDPIEETRRQPALYRDELLAKVAAVASPRPGASPGLSVDSLPQRVRETVDSAPAQLRQRMLDRLSPGGRR
ncbi:MAG: hypothetical protein HY815_25895 [Candidatus Riflebacteria bacterium]|nr:hypothetical protein [Candidatus Riflebacteria bacterium]